MKQSKELNTVRHTTELDPELLSNVRNSIIVIIGHDLEEQERIECNVCYYRNFHARQKLEKINRE